jgi:P4 family phage/plasmid primase-like protien
MNAPTLNIPSALRALPGWLVWKFEQHDGEAKPRKVPYYVGGGKRFGVQGTDEERRRLATFDKALAALQSGRWAGLGLAMLPDWNLVGLDFDNCVVDGRVLPEVEAIVADTYCEFSPSGTGVRAFMAGQIADRKSRATDVFGVEFFHAKGFLTITGNVLDICELVGNEDTVAPLNDAARALYTTRFNAAPVAPAAGAEWEADDPLMVSPPLGLRMADMAEMVLSMDPDSDYLTWAKVGMACHHERNGEEDGFLLWDEWSSKGATYPGQEALREKWASFGRHRGSNITARWLKKEFNAKTAKDKVELVPSDIMNTARTFLEREFTTTEGASLVRSRGLWYEHTGPCYLEKPDESLRAAMWRFLDGATKQVKVEGKDGKAEWVSAPFRPTVSNVTSAIDALKAVALVEGAEPPCWFPGYKGPEAGEVVSVANGLLHIPSRTLIPHSAGFFTLNTLPYGWETKGEPTEWLKFLDQVWPGDAESQETLQEMFGYLLTADTSQQKMFMLIGPKRSGKGTIGRVLSALLGRNNIASPTLTSLTTQFGLQPLIDKLVALVPDARVSAQSNTQAIVERLLMVSGEDCITVDRKHTDSWTGTMSARFVILTNETPQLGDASGALAGRFITLAMSQSFYGREDHGLTSRLLAELPAIFRWALDGRDRLRARGYFIQPKAGVDAADELAEVNSPIGTFVSEMCDVGGAYEVQVDDLYAAWREWCGWNGRDHVGTVQNFGRNLRAATPGVQVRRPRVEGSRERYYDGIRIKPRIAEKLGQF